MNTNPEPPNAPPLIQQASQSASTASIDSPAQPAQVLAGQAGKRKFPIGWIAVGVLALLAIAAAHAVTGYFRLNAGSEVLRDSALAAMPGEWDQRIALSVGWFTTGVIRTGSRFFQMPPEPRAALDSLRGASVAIYQATQDPNSQKLRNLVTSADKAMRSSGWDRVVGVCKERELVAVYFPHRKLTTRNFRCCVLVVQERQLIVASAAGNLEPVLAIAEKHMDLHGLKAQLLANQ